MMIDLPMKQWGSKMVVNWVMVNGSYSFGESIVEVIANKMVEKIAKVSGNKRKERRLTVRLNGFEDEYECGTESFRKGSFLKNLIKKSIHKSIETMAKPHNYLPAIWNPIEKDFIGRTLSQSEEYMLNELEDCETIKDVHKWYKKYARYYHPDFLGRNLFPDEQITFEVITEGRDMACELIRQIEETFNN